MLSDTLISWSAGIRSREYVQRLSTTRYILKSNLSRDQTGGREIVSQSTSKQHYFHLFSAADAVLITQGSFNRESAMVTGPDSEEGRHPCR